MPLSVAHLNPYQLHAIARRWERSVIWDYHPSEHGIDLATAVASFAFGWSNPPEDEVYEAMIALEASGVDCPVYQSSWALQRWRWGKWLQVVAGPRQDDQAVEPAWRARTRAGS